jgi:hypothetical protein
LFGFIGKKRKGGLPGGPKGLFAETDLELQLTAQNHSFAGGRIIGACKYCNSTGIHVTGNNGGVHILMTDVISLHEGIVLDSSNGLGSNRCGYLFLE